VGIVCVLVRSGSVRRERQQAGGCEWAGVALIGGPFLDFRDPWGNRIEIVGYDNIQFTKAPNVLRGMGLTHLAKNEQAKKELAEKGMSVAQD
jgi:lactoylglutathione lyase